MRGLRHYGPFLFLLLIGLSGFSTLAVNRASADAEGDDTIPNQAIRIRIIANSDSDRDQEIKRKVRDDVAALIESWGEMPGTIEEARAFIRSRLADVEAAANKSLKGSKAGYGEKTELAVVDFPAKTFEGKTYPAGQYEALRITLGKGGGANWWCVLFPPLCLAASAKTDDQVETDAKEPAKQTAAAQKGDQADAAKIKKASANAAQEDGVIAAAVPAEKPKAEFFLIVLLEKLFSFIASLFA
ncbi:stage II sporulation protein R [Cohnella hashimotonis]|uniref:Stage II sporulation protein R n=1 Tax=Cohnella hashimotonis TaxID=2826895 RepID=A0ABT6TTP4_9BACL|nr:stage II sporulation protein R [Cohnella hashimotonis]MDI4650233.1 stage II sporulation protein R [Cohnella hashimotonis]